MQIILKFELLYANVTCSYLSKSYVGFVSETINIRRNSRERYNSDNRTLLISRLYAIISKVLRLLRIGRTDCRFKTKEKEISSEREHVVLEARGQNRTLHRCASSSPSFNRSTFTGGSLNSLAASHEERLFRFVPNRPLVRELEN